MDDVQRLLAIQEIAQLKARYFRAVDTKDWEGLKKVFTSDCAWDFSEAGGDDTVVTQGTRGVGPDGFVDLASGAIDGATTTHHGHMPEIDVTSPTSATGIWAMYDRLVYPEGGPVRKIEGWGHYHEEYVKEDGRWLIASVKVTRLDLVQTPW